MNMQYNQEEIMNEILQSGINTITNHFDSLYSNSASQKESTIHRHADEIYR